MTSIHIYDYLPLVISCLAGLITICTLFYVMKSLSSLCIVNSCCFIVGMHPDSSSIEHMGMVWELCVALWGNLPEFRDTGKHGDLMDKPTQKTWKIGNLWIKQHLLYNCVLNIELILLLISFKLLAAPIWYLVHTEFNSESVVGLVASSMSLTYRPSY